MTELESRTRLAAYAWCESDGALLVVRLGPGERAAGRWTLPGGGLDFGEDPAVGVLRELAEETGLVGRLDGILGVHSIVHEPDDMAGGHRLHGVGILFQVEITGGELRDEPDGSSDRAAWIPIDELHDLPLVDLVVWALLVTGR